MTRARLLCLGALGLALASGGPYAVAAGATSSEPNLVQLFRDANAFWTQTFATMAGRYASPTLTFYSHGLANVCKMSFSVAGPFYCPANQQVYLDQDFLGSAMRRAGNARELLAAYVVGHEVAHHVQAVLGTTAAVEQAQSRSTPEIAAGTLSKFELQADCYTGLWLRWAQRHGKIHDAALLTIALQAIAKTSRERQASLAARQVLVDPLTHASEKQRARWIRHGIDTAQFNGCDTFSAATAAR